MQGFDPEFDDTAWTDGWHSVPIVQVPAGEYPGGYRVESRMLTTAEVFGQAFRLSAPMECSFLYDAESMLWMSNTPQERIMMYNNGLRSWGKVLVGGLGLGLYPQYAAIGAAGEATSFTIVEQSVQVRAMVEPVVRQSVGLPIKIIGSTIEEYLTTIDQERFDTIFLDTWATLDAVRLPEINGLRDLAVRYLTEQGRVLLWGYRWMVRLFEDACRQLLSVPPPMRRAWLDSQRPANPRAVEMLVPIVEHLGEKDVQQALAWCRRYAVTLTSAAPPSPGREEPATD